MKMGRQEEERLEMTNGNGETGGGRLEREASPAGAQDPPEMAGKGKGMRLRLSMQFFTHPLSQINLKISSTGQPF